MIGKAQQIEERFMELESVIKSYRGNFYAVGKALKEIRESRLYRRVGFSSFEDYTKRRWDLGKSHAYRLIEASDVIDNVSPIGEVLPQNESQARALMKLDPFNQRKVWKAFLNSGMELRALNIARFVSDYIGKEKGSVRLDSSEMISEDYKGAVMAMLYQIRIAQNEGWESTSRKGALYWNKVMREKILWGT
jgi:hypothetical protein